MNKIKNAGMMLLMLTALFASSCKKKPSALIYNTWVMTSVEMPDADSVTLSQMTKANVTYTFKKGGTYEYVVNDKTGTGTFEINDEGTTLTTDENGVKEMQSVMLTETSLQLSKGNDKMTFNVKK